MDCHDVSHIGGGVAHRKRLQKHTQTVINANVEERYRLEKNSSQPTDTPTVLYDDDKEIEAGRGEVFLA